MAAGHVSENALYRDREIATIKLSSGCSCKAYHDREITTIKLSFGCS